MTWLVFVRPIFKKRTRGKDGRTYHTVAIMDQGFIHSELEADTKEIAHALAAVVLFKQGPHEMIVMSKASWECATSKERANILGTSKQVPHPSTKELPYGR